MTHNLDQIMKDAVDAVERADAEPEVVQAIPTVELDEDAAPPTLPDEAPPVPYPEKAEEPLRDQLLRLAADFENYRKRSREQMATQRQAGIELMTQSLLSVMDNFERALEHTSDRAAFVDGVRMIQRQLEDAFHAFGVRAFTAKGKSFDPQKHEAVGHKASKDVAPGVVLEDVQKGYMIHDRLLRPARVVVAKRKVADHEAAAGE
jgi:molecular chaperone GrpE